MHIFGRGTSRQNQLQSKPLLVHDDPAFVVRTDADAAAIIKSMNFSIFQLTPWVARNPKRFDPSFVRYGGIKRVIRSIQILEKGIGSLDFLDEGNCLNSEEIRAWTLLALAAGVREDSQVVYDSLREAYVGEGTIPFPSDRGTHYVGVRGLGHATEEITCMTRLIKFTLRK